MLELKATDISYGAVSAGVFKVSPPAGAKVVRISTPAGHAAAGHAALRQGASAASTRQARTPRSTGVAAVRPTLPFTLAAPSKLDGLPRQSVSLLDWGGSPAALVTYGQGLGGIAVIEQTRRRRSRPPQSRAARQWPAAGLSLPTVSINGADRARSSSTALGTVLRVQARRRRATRCSVRCRRPRRRRPRGRCEPRR